MRVAVSEGGIPDGVKQGSVTQFIGSRDNIYNSSAIVQTTNRGSYILTIMSNGEGTSWKKLTELTNKIQALKEKKIPPKSR